MSRNKGVSGSSQSMMSQNIVLLYNKSVDGWFSFSTIDIPTYSLVLQKVVKKCSSGPNIMKNIELDFILISN